MKKSGRLNQSIDLPGQIISELVKVLGILAALFAFVLFRQDPRFWIVTVAAGVVVFFAGAFYAFRLYSKRKKRQKLIDTAHERFLSESDIPPVQVVVHAELENAPKSDPSVIIDPDIDKKLDAVQAMHEAGLMSSTEFDRLSDELKAQKQLAMAQAVSISQKLAALKSARDTGVISEAVYRQRVAALSATQIDVLEENESWNVLPPVVITIGFFLILPGIIDLIVQQNNNEIATSFAGYFFTPAIILWIISELIFLFPLREIKPKRSTEILGIVGPGVQVVGAIVLWVYLGLVFFPRNFDLIFYAGVGLALVGLIITIVAIVLSYRQEQKKQLQQVDTLLATQSTNGQEPPPLISSTVADDNIVSLPTAVAPPTPLADPQTVQFEHFIGDNEKYYFRLRDHDGQILLTSQGYRSTQGSEKGIAAVKANAPQIERYQEKVAADGRFYFVLLAGNRRVIGVSQMFGLEEERQAAIGAVMATAVAAPIVAFVEP